MDILCGKKTLKLFSSKPEEQEKAKNQIKGRVNICDGRLDQVTERIKVDREPKGSQSML